MNERVRDSMIVVGMNDAGHLLEGWHARAHDPRCDFAYRATEASGAFEIASMRGAKELVMLLSAPVDLAGGKVSGRIRFENASAPDLPIELMVDAWVMRRVELPKHSSARPCWRMRLEVDNPVIPDQILHNGDGRRIGWMLSAAWLE